MKKYLLIAALFIGGCGSNDFLDLEDWQRDLMIFGVGYLGFDLLGDRIDGLDERITELENTETIIEPVVIVSQGEDGKDGRDGRDGVSCWDLNANLLPDPEEDLNKDGTVDALDCHGEDGVDGSTGLDGEDGVSTFLFNTFVEDFFTVADGSYGSIPLEADELPVVEISEPAFGYCGNTEVDLVAYRVPVPSTYLGDNDVVMRFFLWRTGELNDTCMVFRVDAFRSRHGVGIYQYGAPRFITVETPAEIDLYGTLLVIDLPVNTPNGLDFPADLAQGDLLAVELSNLAGFSDGGCFTVIGVEFYETEGNSVVTNADVAMTFDDIECEQIVDCEMVYDPPPHKEIVCHVPPGNPDNRHTIMISKNAVERHFIHGDTLGPCPGDCEIE